MSEEFEALPWLHIYQPDFPHSEGRVHGTRAGLAAVRDAIDRALSTGRSALAEVIASDGEGYGVEVEIRNRDALEKTGSMYTFGLSVFEETP